MADTGKARGLLSGEVSRPDEHKTRRHTQREIVDRAVLSLKDAGVPSFLRFGDKRGTPVPAPPRGLPQPQSAAEMEAMLRGLLPEEKRDRIAVIVLDVSGEH
jgi:hypothetical protein